MQFIKERNRNQTKETRENIETKKLTLKVRLDRDLKMPGWIHACDLLRRLVANLRFLPVENLPLLVACDQTMQFDRLGSSALLPGYNNI
jgi:hypothetical protein